MTGFGAFVRRAHASGHLVVQPRMGFGSVAPMREGLLATKRAAATTVGTITVDSYTRVGDLQVARAALRDGADLNGYPVAGHDARTTRHMLSGVRDADFPVQVRHGSAAPAPIIEALIDAGIDATEGGPVSYCLPYGRVPLADSVTNWARACRLLARLHQQGPEPHLETFGGCMLGQLCPPSQLVALSVLEALFFYRHGIRSISVSYAQQANAEQDREAVLALRRLCSELLPADWHLVVYAYMGLYPESREGAHELLAQATELAVRTGSERLIVKTVAESRRIPTIAENVAALEYAAAVARRRSPRAPAAGSDGKAGSGRDGDTQIYREARGLVEAVLPLDRDIGQALIRAFARGYLDIPYCVHPDNRGRTRSYLDVDGRIGWSDIGALPLRGIAEVRASQVPTSRGLMDALSRVQRTFDHDRPAGAITKGSHG